VIQQVSSAQFNNGVLLLKPVVDLGVKCTESRKGTIHQRTLPVECILPPPGNIESGISGNLGVAERQGCIPLRCIKSGDKYVVGITGFHIIEIDVAVYGIMPVKIISYRQRRAPGTRRNNREIQTQKPQI